MGLISHGSNWEGFFSILSMGYLITSRETNRPKALDVSPNGGINNSLRRFFLLWVLWKLFQSIACTTDMGAVAEVEANAGIGATVRTSVWLSCHWMSTRTSWFPNETSRIGGRSGIVVPWIMVLFTCVGYTGIKLWALMNIAIEGMWFKLGDVTSEICSGAPLTSQKELLLMMTMCFLLASRWCHNMKKAQTGDFKPPEKTTPPVGWTWNTIHGRHQTLKSLRIGNSENPWKTNQNQV